MTYYAGSTIIIVWAWGIDCGNATTSVTAGPIGDVLIKTGSGCKCFWTCYLVLELG